MELMKIILIVFLAGAEMGLAQDSCSTLAAGPSVSGSALSETQIVALLDSISVSPYHHDEVRRIFPHSAVVRPAMGFKLFARQATRYPGTAELGWAAAILERSLVETPGTSDFKNIDLDPKDVLVAIHNGPGNLSFGTWTRIFKYGKQFQTEDAFQESLQFGVSVLQRRMEAKASFPGLSQYLRYKLIKESVKRELGLEYDLISDLATFETSPGNFSVAAYATVPMAGRTDEFGFSYRVIAELKGEAGVRNHAVKWEAGGKQYSGAVTLKALGKSSLVPSFAFKPDYKGMLKDGKLIGAVLFSGNLKEFIRDLVPTYEEYLEAEGFKKRSDQILPFHEAQAFISSKIQKMEFDYMLKEGHGHPSAWGLIDLTSNVRIVSYRLSQETIYLIFPADPLGISSHMTVDQLGEALRARHRATQEFLYVDTGCRAEGDLCNLTKGVAAAGFTPVGSGQDVATFSFADGDAVYEILHGIRNKKSYRSISKAIVVRNDSGSVIPHGFVFPDSFGYVLRKNGGELKRKVDRYSVQVHVGPAPQ